MTTADFDADWEVIDNLRDITYTLQDIETGTYLPEDAQTLIDAFCHGEKKNDEITPDDGQAYNESKVYHLRASQLSSVVRKRGKIYDTLTGETWIITGNIQYQTWGTRIRCECTRYEE